MKITQWNPSPLLVIPFRQAESGGRIGTGLLEITTAHVEGLPYALDGLIATSDLQGLSFDGELLGILAARELYSLCKEQFLPPVTHLGVLLAGDFFASPDLVRGVSGEVGPVWDAFRERFRWVAGVAGNHDILKDENTQTLLDGEVIKRDGVSIGGIGRVIGEQNKPGQHTPEQFSHLLQTVAKQEPDILLLHTAPAITRSNVRGDSSLENLLNPHPFPFIICGHCYWQQPVQQRSNGGLICNVDGRVIVLLKPEFR